MRALQKDYVFVISEDDETDTKILAVRDDNWDRACQKAHAHLKAQRPELWLGNWHDLRQDCLAGKQTCYAVPAVTRL